MKAIRRMGTKPGDKWSFKVDLPKGDVLGPPKNAPGSDRWRKWPIRVGGGEVQWVTSTELSILHDAGSPELAAQIAKGIKDGTYEVHDPRIVLYGYRSTEATKDAIAASFLTPAQIAAEIFATSPPDGWKPIVEQNKPKPRFSITNTPGEFVVVGPGPKGGRETYAKLNHQAHAIALCALLNGDPGAAEDAIDEWLDDVPEAP